MELVEMWPLRNTRQLYGFRFVQIFVFHSLTSVLCYDQDFVYKECITIDSQPNHINFKAVKWWGVM